MDTTTNIADELAATLQRQRDAHKRQPYPDWATRAARLRALRVLLVEHETAICEAINKDFGCRPAEETRLLELFPARDGIDHALRHGRRWMRPRRRFASRWFLPARTELLPQPLGVIGIIVPWNYPLYLAIGPVIDALAAGNRVMVKMSEHTPHFSALFADLAQRHFPDGEIVVITGDTEVARTFSALPFDHLLFTGSTGVGRKVMQAAAENLVPVTLELGGKSPVIIAADADFEHAVERVVYGKCINAGQTCIAPDYVLLPSTRIDDFIRIARASFARMYPDFAQSNDYASIITERQHQRLRELHDDAIAHGASAHVLEPAGAHPVRDGFEVRSGARQSRTGCAPTDSDKLPRRMAPTLLTDVDTDSRVMQEEIFGPLLSLIPCDDIKQALDFIDARPHPLSLYLFTRDRGIKRNVLERHLAGGVTVNDTLYHIAQHGLPFGGVGASGMGSYHGEYGFGTFSKMKPVFHQSRFNGAGLLSPPYNARFQRVMKWLLRH